MQATRRKLCWPSSSRFLTFSDHQQQAYQQATQGYLSVLSGKPGTGKTYVSAASVGEIERMSFSSVAVCAPTGKAAVRCTGAMQGHGLDITATTIHRLLGVAKDENGWHFTYDAKNPLPYTHIVLDEASMLGSGLAASFFSACRPDTHVLLVGDTFQLPPVDHGAVLRDLIDAQVSHGHLSEIRRNSGAIVQACHDIANGKSFNTYSAVNEAAGENLVHLESGDSEDQVRRLLKILAHMPIKSHWDCQVVAPLNKKSPVSRSVLNKKLQDFLNPTGTASSKHHWREGDKILCLRNTFRSDSEKKKGNRPKEKLEHFIANGEVGQVVYIEDKRIFAKFLDPFRLVVIPLGALRDEDDEEEENGNVDFDLGYALTVHKSQGSQWPLVVCLVDEAPGARMVGSREFWYTAMSRAERVCVTIGQRRLMNLDCQKTALQKRKTLMAERVLAEITA